MQVHVAVVEWDSHQHELSLIRQAVFTEEQGVPAHLDLDGQDAVADHLLAINEAGQPIGCARLLPSGQIGRMAVMPQWRRRGIGSCLLAKALEAAKAKGLTWVFLHAQVSAQPFYREHGFLSIGEEFMEAGIPHLAMELALPIPFEAPEATGKPTVREQQATSASDKAELRQHHGEGDCLRALRSVMVDPRRDVNIYSPYLDHLLFNRDEVVDPLSQFARRAPLAQLNILIHSSDLIVSRGHRLLALARRLESKIEIRRVPDELGSDASSYVTWDNHGYWLMPDFREYEAMSNVYDPAQANRLNERFGYLWQRSTPDPELRLLRL